MRHKHKLFDAQPDDGCDFARLKKGTYYAPIEIELKLMRHEVSSGIAARVFTIKNAKRLNKWLTKAIKKAEKK